MPWLRNSETILPVSRQNSGLDSPVRAHPTHHLLSTSADASPPHEIVLILSGLNFQPEAMDSLAELLTGERTTAVIGFPNGYFSGLGDEGCQDPQEWLRQLDQTMAELQKKYPGALISLLGFSLGALLGLAWCLEGETNRPSQELSSRGWHRAVLIAPAFCPRGCNSALLGGLLNSLPGGWQFPALTPKGYRMKKHTPLAAYRSVLRLARSFQEKLNAMPTEELDERLPPQFLAYTPRDELVSSRYLRAYGHQYRDKVHLHRLNHWAYPSRAHHLATDPDVLGAREWDRLAQALATWTETTNMTKTSHSGAAL